MEKTERGGGGSVQHCLARFFVFYLFCFLWSAIPCCSVRSIDLVYGKIRNVVGVAVEVVL